jgi:hypothetical protein
MSNVELIRLGSSMPLNIQQLEINTDRNMILFMCIYVHVFVLYFFT